jgi:flagellar capping protein FliD
VNLSAEAGGALEARVNGDGEQVTELTSQISTMNEMLAQREKTLQATYAELESVMSQNTSQSTWLTSQEKQLQASGI